MGRQLDFSSVAIFAFAGLLGCQFFQRGRCLCKKPLGKNVHVVGVHDLHMSVRLALDTDALALFVLRVF